MLACLRSTWTDTDHFSFCLQKILHLGEPKVHVHVNPRSYSFVIRNLEPDRWYTFRVNARVGPGQSGAFESSDFSTIAATTSK